MVQFYMLTIFSLSIDFTLQHVTFTLLPCWMSFYHGQILIETETDSFIVNRVLDLMDLIGPIGDPAFSSQTLIGGL